MSIDKPEIDAKQTMSVDQFMDERGLTGGVQLEQDSAAKRTRERAQQILSDTSQRYEIRRQIDKGGMGAVLDARDQNIRRRVAMKVMLHTQQAPKEAKLRFIEEAQVTAQLEHPNIVSIHELGVDGEGALFYTMTYVNGVTLKSILDNIHKSRKETIDRYPLARLLTIFQKTCDAVAYAHSKGVVHRDLKPENIMVGDYGEVLVMDWGLAKVLPQDHKDDQSDDVYDPSQTTGNDDRIESLREDGLETVVGQVLGTPSYMAPEQACGRAEKIDTRTDIYALGGILYNILTLHPPVPASTDVTAVLRMVARGQVTDPLEYNKSSRLDSRELMRAKDITLLQHCPDRLIPESLAAVSMKALSSKRMDRYQAVQEIQAEVHNYQEGFATSAEAASVWRQFWLLAKRNKPLVMFVLGSCVLLAFVVLAFTIQLNSKKAGAEASRQAAVRSLEYMKKEKQEREALARDSLGEVMKRARLAIRRRQPIQAETEVERALKLNDRWVEAWALKGILALGTDRFDDAIHAFQKVETLDPEGMGPTVSSYIELAQEYRGHHKLDLAQTNQMQKRLRKLPRILGYRARLFNTITIPDLETELMRLPGGTFTMGSANGTADEQPTHQVTISKHFWIGRNEVTKSEFRMFVVATKYKSTAEKLSFAYSWEPATLEPIQLDGVDWQSSEPKDAPVINITDTDAFEFCKWLTTRERTAERVPDGYEYRLPTEAEWEYACRAGTDTDFSFGSSIRQLHLFANYCESANSSNFPHRETRFNDQFDRVAPVRSFRPNPWNLFDMHGNVWELCLDRCDTKPAVGVVTDTYVDGATDPLSREGLSRVARGGSWAFTAAACRSADRKAFNPNRPTDFIGFRIVLAPKITVDE